MVILLTKDLIITKVNYFELYELPVSFNINAGLLRTKFYELSKRFHPDFYVNESEEKQEEILNLSTQINKAYNTLSNQQKLVEYILTLFQLLADGDKYALPQTFLMEMMEVNEVLMELEFEANISTLQKVNTQVKGLENGLLNELALHTALFDKNEDDKKNILLKIKDIWYRQKYLLRIRDTLNKFATR